MNQVNQRKFCAFGFMFNIDDKNVIFYINGRNELPFELSDNVDTKAF